MKKSLFVLAIVMLAALLMAMPVMAAPTADEQKIIDALNAAGVPADYVSQASGWLESVDVSAADAAAIVGQINAADATAADRAAADIPQADRYAILSNIQAAAAAVNLNVGVNGRAVTVTDSGGAVVVSATAPARGTVTYETPNGENPVKATGFTADFSALIFTGAVLSSLFGLAIALGYRRKFASATAA